MKCTVTKTNQSSQTSNDQAYGTSRLTNHQRKCRRRSSASRLLTSPAGAVTSLILMRNCNQNSSGSGSRRSRPSPRGERAKSRAAALRNTPSRAILITPTALFITILVSLFTQVSINPASASASSLSLTISDSTVSTSILGKGSYSDKTSNFVESSSSTITASTDNVTGYTLSIVASDGTNPTKLIDSQNNDTTTNYLESISSAVSASDIRNGIYTPTHNGEWGYKPSKLNSDNNSNYLPSPGTTGDILDVTNGPNTGTGNENTYTISIGALVDSTVKPGAYANTFNVILVGNAVNYSITYNDTVVSNMPVDVLGTADSSGSVAISSLTPTREGYTFTGWCDQAPTITSNVYTCDGTTYQASDPFYMSNVSSNDLSLYAMWSKSGGGGGGGEMDAPYIQDFTVQQCSELASASDYLVKDRRDRQVYTVRYINNKCWMTRNLAIGCDSKWGIWYGSTVSQTALDSTDSNVTNSSDNPWNTPTALLSQASSSTSTADYSNPRMQCNENYGGYYNYAAATAGTILTNNNSTEATNDICPKNWHLPSQSDFNGITSATATFSPIYSGYYDIGLFSNAGSEGRWWSSTASSTMARYYLYYYSGSLTVYSNSRYGGRSVRCMRS